MIKARRNVRRDRAGPYGVECLEGRALLSGFTQVATATTTVAARPAVVAPSMVEAATNTTTVKITPARPAAVAPPMVEAATNTTTVKITPAQPAAVAPPMLEKSHLLRNGNTVTGLVMTFSKPLDPATAQDLKNYQVHPRTEAAGNGAVSAAVYNPAQDSVTLILAQPVTLKPASRGVLFEVNNPNSNGQSESTITDTSGQALQSTGDGQPDGRLFAQFKARGSTPNPLSLASRLARWRAVSHKSPNLGDSIASGLIHIRELFPFPFP